MRIPSTGIVVVVSLWLQACGSAVQPAPRAAVDLEGETCPSGLPGLAVRTAEIEAGYALVFTARPDSVGELRERLTRFVQIQSSESRELGDPSARIHQSTMRVLDIPDGAQLEVRPLNPGRLPELRDELRADQRAITAGRCPLAFEVMG